MSNFIGPALPPNLITESCDDSGHSENDQPLSVDSQDDVVIGPSLPPHILRAASEDPAGCDWERGPPKLMRKKITQSETSEDSMDNIIGPTLPFQMSRSKTEKDSSTGIFSASLTHNDDSKPSQSVIGPSLPPKLRTKLQTKTLRNSSSSDDESGVIGPVLPTHLKHSSDEDDATEGLGDVCVIGPTLPPFLKPKTEQQLSGSVTGKKHRSVSVIGPSLPPHLQPERDDELPTVVEDEFTENNSKSEIGPLFPPHLKLEGAASENENEDITDMYGPALPPGLRPNTLPIQRLTKEEERDESEDDDMGPLPEGYLSGSKVQQQLELRARHLREAMVSGESSTSDTATQRESWMLELPADRAPELGLHPRQFRMREGPEAGDRSVWTDTPADRERKKKVPKLRSPDTGALEKEATLERDKAMQQLAEQHGSKRGTRSLVDLHEEKLQAKRKKAEEAGEMQERRPFSRDVDLQVNRFDEAQKRSILKKAQHLNDRFSSGQSKFL